ncbi:MAG: hypothetical protein JO162_16200 [Alphaproteobacteria bacterium]|nr:hypothetical protein [Alphaproteobacteria bacterium]MBV9015784.1 hypothetical protein [Alphaproteobacteria bacterium]MBV9150413.1 hypothetical protein [Alphaproteobacteria bacterium]MBV9585104.1 hypothetical protein [Alphaproteobacteria bacterium]MBV9964683.1 hypothetical protein [Alphaproteobacteria bacterium]
MRLRAPVIIAVLAITGACSRGPYCYEWNEAYSRGEAVQTAAAHQEWIAAHLPEDILKLVKDGDVTNRSRLRDIEHLVMTNCDLHATLPVATVLGDLITSYRAGNFKLFKE